MSARDIAGSAALTCIALVLWASFAAYASGHPKLDMMDAAALLMTTGVSFMAAAAVVRLFGAHA